jgi:hypothetical protein
MIQYLYGTLINQTGEKEEDEIFFVENGTNYKNAVTWVVTPCGFCKNRCFGGSYCLLHREGDKNREARNNVSSNFEPRQAAKEY